jgi:hypothetical protein
MKNVINKMVTFRSTLEILLFLLSDLYIYVTSMSVQRADTGELKYCKMIPKPSSAVQYRTYLIGERSPQLQSFYC